MRSEEAKALDRCGRQALLVTSNYALMPLVNVLIIYTRRPRS